MGKTNLPVFPQYGAPELVIREGRGCSQATSGENLGTGEAFLGNPFYERWETRMKE
jgi:hypothetical protein